MNAITTLKTVATRFVKDEEGAQVVEYALIIAVISIGLLVAIDTAGLGTTVSSFVAKVASCMAGTTC